MRKTVISAALAAALLIGVPTAASAVTDDTYGPDEPGEVLSSEVTAPADRPGPALAATGGSDDRLVPIGLIGGAALLVGSALLVRRVRRSD